MSKIKTGGLDQYCAESFKQYYGNNLEELSPKGLNDDFTTSDNISQYRLVRSSYINKTASSANSHLGSVFGHVESVRQVQ